MEDETAQKIREAALFNASMVVQAMMEHGQLSTPAQHGGGWNHHAAPRLSPDLVIEYATAFEKFLTNGDSES